MPAYLNVTYTMNTVHTTLSWPTPQPLLCIFDQILIIAPTRFALHWHHLQGTPFKCKFFETHHITCSKQVTVIIWYVLKNLQLNGAPLWRCHWRPKCIRAVINVILWIGWWTSFGQYKVLPNYFFFLKYIFSGIKISNSLPHSLTILKNEMAKFQVAQRKYLNTHSPLTV